MTKELNDFWDKIYIIYINNKDIINQTCSIQYWDIAYSGN